MNNKITKTRIKTFFLYDTLKTVIATVAICFLLLFIFNLSSVQPSNGQRFTLLIGSDVIYGEESGEVLLKTAEKGSNTYSFSYEILNFSYVQITGESANQDLVVKRDTYEDDIFIGTKELTNNYVETLGAVSFDRYMKKAETYLSKFLDENTGEIDEKKVIENFNKTRKKDNRFRGSENQKKGIKLEIERIQILKNNYDTLLSVFKNHKEIFAQEYKNNPVLPNEVNEFGYAIELSKLKGKPQKDVKNAFRVVAKNTEGNNNIEYTAEGIYLTVGNNFDSDGDLCYEPMAYILNLINTYTDFI